MMFSLYSEPVQSGQGILVIFIFRVSLFHASVLESDSRKLWNHIDPYFRQHVTNLLLRTQSRFVKPVRLVLPVTVTGGPLVIVSIY